MGRKKPVPDGSRDKERLKEERFKGAAKKRKRGKRVK